MVSDSQEQQLTQKSFRIKQDDRFFSRLLSKETSMANCSSRVYYVGASGSVPFLWESQPGTPKHLICDNSLPPLTPPPSYQSTSNSKNFQKNIMKPKLLNTILPSRLNSKKNHVAPSSSTLSCTSSSPSSSSSSWSSSNSFPSRSKNSSKFCSKRRCFSCSTLPIQYDYGMDDDDHEDHQEHQRPGHGSPTSTLCFGTVKPRTLTQRRGCYSLVNMKNALLSIVGNGSSGQTSH